MTTRQVTGIRYLLKCSCPLSEPGHKGDAWCAGPDHGSGQDAQLHFLCHLSFPGERRVLHFAAGLLTVHSHCCFPRCCVMMAAQKVQPLWCLTGCHLTGKGPHICGVESNGQVRSSGPATEHCFAKPDSEAGANSTACWHLALCGDSACLSAVLKRCVTLVVAKHREAKLGAWACRAINKSVTICEIIKRRILGLHQNAEIGSVDITDTWEPLEEGLSRLETTCHVSVVRPRTSPGAANHMSGTVN